MDNPYSGELPKINKIAEDVQTIFEKISQLEIQASNIQSQISQVPYQTDEDGYDVNEGQRNALYAQLNSVNSLIEEANETRHQLQSEAHSLALYYQSEILKYEKRERNTAGTLDPFDNVSKHRFGGKTALASLQFVGQRDMYYIDYVSVLRELKEAAENAANGLQTIAISQTIADRGEFHNPNTLFYGNHLGSENDLNEKKIDLEDNNWSGIPGKSIKNTNDNMAASILKNLEMDGIPYHEGKPDFFNVSHALVNTKIPDADMVVEADAMLAKKYGVTEADIVSYREENGLEWRDDGNGVKYLIPESISKAYYDVGETPSSHEIKEKVLHRNLSELTRTGMKNIENILEVRRDDMLDKGMPKHEIDDAINKERAELQQEFFRDAFPNEAKINATKVHHSGMDRTIRNVVEQNVSKSVLPKSGGHWSDAGKPGESMWIPDDDVEIVWQKGGRTHKMLGIELKKKYGIEGINYFGNEPDFEPFEDELLGHVEVDEFTDSRTGKEGTFTKATNNVAQLLGWSSKQVERYMEERGLTWHECGDRKTIRAIPTEINSAFKHTGGIGIEKSVKSISEEIYDNYGTIVLSRESHQGTVSKSELDSAIRNRRENFKDRKKNS